MRFLLIICALLTLASIASAGDYVHGYTRSDGTYVAPYYRSSPDSSLLNNYSTQGNVSPYTGQAGTVKPYPTTNPYAPNSLGRGNDMLGRIR